MNTIKKYAGEVVSIGVAVGVILTIAINLSPSLHLPAGTVAIISTAAAVLAAVVNFARQVVAYKIALNKAAK